MSRLDFSDNRGWFVRCRHCLRGFWAPTAALVLEVLAGHQSPCGETACQKR